MRQTRYSLLIKFSLFILLFGLSFKQIMAATNPAPNPILPQQGPIPLLRPLNAQNFQQEAIIQLDIDDIITNSIPILRKNNITSDLKPALDALNNNQINRAISIRDRMSSQSIDRHILTWAIATSSKTDVSSFEIYKAMVELNAWPGMTTMRKNYERALARENNTPQTIINAFSKNTPITVDGMVALGQALLETNQADRANKIIGPWWQKTKLSATEEKLVLQKLSPALTKLDHLARMRTMLYAYRIDSAQRVSALANAQSLYQGFAAVARNQKNALKKLNAVDKYWQKDPVFLFAKIQYYRRNGQYEKAAQLMQNAPKDATHLVDPDAWWVERRVLSRELLDINQPQLAYQLAKNHSAESASMAADAEFHAGWYALRFLNNPKIAMQHFKEIATISSRPISMSRSYYWMGRSFEALANIEEARQAYQIAAHYGTSYYGQLAQAKLGINTLEIPYPKPSEIERQIFSAREAVIAIKRLEDIGYGEHAQMLYRELSYQIDNPGELALLAVMAEKQDDHYTSLRIGKTAVLRGLDVGSLSHPLGAIPQSANISSSGKALAYAIARQESEFKVDAISSAGAMGMLQLLPQTAKSVAFKNNMKWSKNKLTTDAAYNATLGAHFLGEQLERFNGSYILTFIGYNAGARRANEWIERYGDPRGQPIDKVVDFVERIPYPETRNYVMRVMENYEVYKARISGSTNIAIDLVSGRRG